MNKAVKGHHPYRPHSEDEQPSDDFADHRPLQVEEVMHPAVRIVVNHRNGPS
jgi:hypothetical protein